MVFYHNIQHDNSLTFPSNNSNQYEKNRQGMETGE